MKPMKWFALPVVLLIILSFMVLRTTFAAHAAPASKCSGWKVVASPNARYGNGLMSVAAIAANDIWAVGSSVSAQGAYFTLTEHWNGSKWSVVSSPNVGPYPNFLSSVVAVSTNDVWAVGDTYTGNTFPFPQQPLIEHWDGSAWTVVASPKTQSTYSVLSGVTAVSANDVWAVGTISVSKKITHTLIEQWNGTKWSIVPTPNPAANHIILSAVTAASASDIWAVGESGGPGVYQTLIEQWNGSAWNIVSSPDVPNHANFLNSVSVTSANSIWAVGYAGNHSSNQTLVEQWNGTSWNIVQAAKLKGQNTFNGVAAIAANDVWAVGSVIEQWNGKQWSLVSSPNPGGPSILYGVTQVPNTKNLWSVGYYEPSSGGSRTLTEYYCG